ncbi:MAG: flagellar biosynthetic protein FliO [Oscillospiraceae bacterium]
MQTTSPWELIYLVIVLVGVVALAYYVSKWLSKRCAVQGQNTKYLKVIDRIALGQDRTLCIVQVGDKAMLLGVTQHNIGKICDINIEDLPKVQSGQGTSFANTLKNTLKNNWGFNVGSKSPDDEGEKSLDDK